MAEQKSQPIAVVTGVSKGIGLAAALKFIELGYVVIGCARSKTKMQELQQKYTECDFSSVDIADASAVQQWSQRVLDKYGSPDLLINNAGVGAEKAIIEDIAIKDMDKIIDVNVKGVMYVMKYFVSAMKKNTDKMSKIVTISSPSGRNGFAQMSVYCASKWAVEGLMMSVAQEMPEHMMACAYNPGGIITEIIYYLVPELEGQIEECVKRGAVGPTQWAEVCVPHIIALKREEMNGKPIDRPNLKELLSNNWKVYREVAQEVRAKQQEK